MVVRTILRQPEKSAQRGRGEKGWTCYYCEKEGHLKWDCLRLLSCPYVLSAKGHTGGETAHRGIGPRDQTLRTIRTESAQLPHTSSHSNYIWGTLGINSCSGPINQFPFRHWGNLLCAYWIPWPTFFPIHYCNRTVWTSQTLLFQFSSKLQLGLCAVFPRVSDRARVPSPLLGRDILSKVHASVFMTWRPLFLSH